MEISIFLDNFIKDGEFKIIKFQRVDMTDEEFEKLSPIKKDVWKPE